MKKITLLFSILIFSVSLFAQSTTVHDDNAQTRNVSSFHAVEVSSGIHLYLKQGNANAVAVSASSSDIINKIKTEVENGTLKIYVDMHGEKNWNSRNKNMKAYVTIKNIDALELSSGANGETDGTINAGELKVSLSSGAGFNGSVTASKLLVDQSSGSGATIKGKAAEATIKVSSGANFMGFDLLTDVCNANVSSGSNIEISVNKELNGEASSGGNIDYKGNTSINNIRKSSGGKVQKKG